MMSDLEKVVRKMRDLIEENGSLAPFSEDECWMPLRAHEALVLWNHLSRLEQKAKQLEGDR